MIGNLESKLQDTRTVDYDLHGIVGIRLLNPTSGDIKAVDRQLGPIRSSLRREPDIILEFVNQLPIKSSQNFLGREESGFTEDAFLVLSNQHHRVRVQIPFEQIGGGCRIVCESNLPAVPLLIPIINLTALANGALPIHASAFEYNRYGVLVTGWSKGGKTEALLAFMAHGARYIGDEWVYISPNGQSMYGIPQPVRVWDWHLQSLPLYWKRVGSGDRFKIKAILSYLYLDRLFSKRFFRKLFSTSTSRKVRSTLQRQTYVDLQPEQIFGQDQLQLSGSLDKVFFVGSYDKPKIIVRPINPEEVARRMVHSMEYESLPFLSYYLAFRFAFPGARNEFIEEVSLLQQDRLNCILKGKEISALYHPYPVSLPSLFSTMSETLR